MAVSQTSRFQIYTWSADTDSFTREQMQESHANLENLAAKIQEGSIAPTSSGPSVGKTFYFDTVLNVLYYFDGTEWNRINPAFGTPVSTGTANAQGSAVTVARSDHVHSIGNNTLTSAKFNASVAGAGLSVDNTAMSVNVDDSTLQINSDTLRVKNGGIQQVHTDTASRLVHISEGTAAPIAAAAVGDLNIRKGNKQLYYYSAEGWVDYNLVNRAPAIKVSWNATFDSSVSAATIDVPWTASPFPATAEEKNLWAPIVSGVQVFGVDGTTTGNVITTKASGYAGYGGSGYGRVLRLPYTGFYSITADAAWDTGADGSRGISVYATIGGVLTELNGGETTVALNANTNPFTRINCVVYHAATAGDFIKLVVRHDGYTPNGYFPYLRYQGANMTIKFESAL